MLASLHKTVEDHIITLLASRGRAPASVLLELLEAQGKPCTLQGIYRILRKLQDAGVVTKVKQEYSLRISWLMNMNQLVDDMGETYLNEGYMGELLPDMGVKHTWHFLDLLKLNHFRYQLLHAMAQSSEHTVALSYTPHLWSMIIDKEQEISFQNIFKTQMPSAYTVVGARTYLDQYIHSVMKDVYPSQHFYLASPDECIEHKRTTAVDIIGDYILQVKLHPQTSEHIEHVFDHTEPLQDIDSLDLLPLLTQSSKSRIILKKHAQKARWYRKQFENLFGPLHKTKNPT